MAKGMRLSLPDSRGSSLTLIGALSEARGLIHFEIVHGSNNAETFEHFVIGLKSKVEKPKTFVVLDNLSVHKAKAVKRHFTWGFEQLFLPPYSCELNPIEHLWNVIKNKWRRQLHHFAETFTIGRRHRGCDAETRLRDIIGKF